MSKSRHESGSAVGKGSWKGQFERTRSWQVGNEIGKNEVGKPEPKFESTTEVYNQSWKVTIEVGKFSIKLITSI